MNSLEDLKQKLIGKIIIYEYKSSFARGDSLKDLRVIKNITFIKKDKKKYYSIELYDIDGTFKNCMQFFTFKELNLLYKHSYYRRYYLL